jgi:hypothetical protein
MVDDLDHVLYNFTGIHSGLAMHAYDHLIDGAYCAVRGRENPLRSDEGASAELPARCCLQRDQPLVIARRVDGNTSNDARVRAEYCEWNGLGDAFAALF